MAFFTALALLECFSGEIIYIFVERHDSVGVTLYIWKEKVFAAQKSDVLITGLNVGAQTCGKIFLVYVMYQSPK